MRQMTSAGTDGSRELAGAGDSRTSARAGGRLTAAVVAIGLGAACLVLLGEAAYGVHLIADSLRYVSAANSLLEGNGWLIWNGAPYNGNGPLFPFILAVVARLFRVGVVEAAGYVNAAALGLAVFFTAMWVERHVQSRALVLWTAFACALAMPIVELAATAATDILFAACACALLFALDRFLAEGRRSFLVGAATAAATGGLTRYAGIFFVAFGLCVVWLHRGAQGGLHKDKVRNAATWLGVAGLPVVAWTLRDLIVPGLYYRIVFHSPVRLVPGLHDVFGTAVSWIYGGVVIDWLDGLAQHFGAVSLVGNTGWLSLAIKVALAVVPTAVALRLLARRRGDFAATSRNRLLLPFAFTVGHTLFLAVVLAMIWVPVNARYFVPICPPLLVIAAVLLDGVVSERQDRAPRASSSSAAGRRPAWALLAAWVWLAPQAWTAGESVAAWNAEGKGYGSRQWTESELLAYVAPRLADIEVFSNSMPAFYLSGATGRINEFDQYWGRLSAQLLAARATGKEVWAAVTYRDLWRRLYDYDLEDFGALPGFGVVAMLEDGVVLGAVNSASDDDGDSAGDDDGHLAGSEGTVARALRTLLDSARLATKADFDVHVGEGGRRLHYVRDECGNGSDGYTGPELFLHVHPVDVSDLPTSRRRHGFEELDFAVNNYGGSVDGKCFATRVLPPYPIAKVTTGQRPRFAGDPEWSVEFALP